ncbi:major facilitator superfamily domain-containing protein [Aspergillus stella-maris]|uniref:major facilitator superfamily domain-containing protein n=1 Tax=Aspergillus stella-maris TaxID=1810926 RepID=UPI003CCE46B3
MVQGWRSSRALAVGTACIAMFTETLLYGFLTPILPYMLEVRLYIDPAQTQSLTTQLQTTYGVVLLVATPLNANLADRIKSRKMPLLVSLGTCLIGTLLVASTPSLPAVYVGRILQATADSAAWIVGLAMLTDNVDEKDLGKMMGICMSFVIAGTVGGPAISGALLQYAGYWPAWTVPMAFLTIDILARLFIVDSQRYPDSDPGKGPLADDTDRSPLLRTDIGTRINDRNTDRNDERSHETKTTNFYTYMLSDFRVLAGLANSVVLSSLLAGFSATWPVHLQQIFMWKSASVGAVFLILQLPLALLSPISGWLRDRVGTRDPAVLGWTLLAPFVFGLGVPGAAQIHGHWGWIRPGHGGESLFIVCVAGIGFLQPLVHGAGLLNTMSKASNNPVVLSRYSLYQWRTENKYCEVALQAIESEHPGIFGPNGGRSRAFAINEVAFNSGLVLGPLISGSFSEAFGYFYMNMTLDHQFAATIAPSIDIVPPTPALKLHNAKNINPNATTETTCTSTGNIILPSNPTHPNLIQINRNPEAYSNSAASLVTLPPGALFTKISSATPTWKRTYSSVATCEDTQVELNDDLVFCNHSCAPSLIFDMKAMEVRVGGKGIKKGDDLTFFYPSSEWTMAQPFVCACGAGGCLGFIEGSKSILKDVLARYWLNEHIEELLKERK